MANYGKRLSFFSWSGPRPEALLSDERYQRLEAIYGVQLTDVAREELKLICDSYVSWRVPELDGETFADATALFDKVNAAVAAFTPLAFGSLFPVTDAGAQLNNMLEHHLRSRPVQIPFKNIFDAEGNMPDETEDGGYRQVVLSMDTLMRVGIALQAAVNLTRKEIEQIAEGSGPVGFAPGQSFEVWARNLQGWANEFSLPKSLFRNDDSPAPFTNFFFALNRMMPPPYNESIASPEALGKRIKRLRRKAKQIAGGTNTAG
jgi:hypothetical protein